MLKQFWLVRATSNSRFSIGLTDFSLDLSHDVSLFALLFHFLYDAITSLFFAKLLLDADGFDEFQIIVLKLLEWLFRKFANFLVVLVLTRFPFEPRTILVALSCQNYPRLLSSWRLASYESSRRTYGLIVRSWTRAREGLPFITHRYLLEGILVFITLTVLFVIWVVEITLVHWEKLKIWHVVCRSLWVSWNPIFILRNFTLL